ncbi:MAG: hypothetical protein LBV72_19920 [Tannerella sp.]|jgi:hypothetical protein|nr:hypothetical protein [Tannerella sp.]
MGKFILAATLNITIENYSHGSPCIQMVTPMTYSLFDLVQIIRLYTGYSDTYDWTFINPYEKNKDLSLRNNSDNLENVKLNEFRNITPFIKCIYGSIEMHLGVRGHLKYGKVYPTIYQAVGKFPTEEEFIKNIQIPDIDGKYTIPGKSLPSASHLINNDLIEYGEKLKDYFKNKYKISNEIEEESTFKPNKLVRK